VPRSGKPHARVPWASALGFEAQSRKPDHTTVKEAHR
jgi:hypothetical protein